MALPPTPPGYDNWNDYIETEAPVVATAQGITLQQAKASLKLLNVSEPIRSDFGQPYYREYNVFTTWADRAVLPTMGRPWKSSATFDILDRFNGIMLNREGDEILSRP